MKNLLKLFVPMTVAVMSLAACNKEMKTPEPEFKITVRAIQDTLKTDAPKADAPTRTYINGSNAIIWGTGEYMKLALTAGENTTFANSTDASADVFNGDTEAMFEFSVTPGEANSYVYQGLYPASAAAPTSNTNAANYKVNLPSIQNATASSYDPAAYILVAKPETFTSVQADWEASFRRGTALNKITLKNVPDGVSFNKVKITAEGKKLAGGRHFNLTTGEGLEVYGTDATIEVLYATPLSGTNVDVWFTSWDVEIEENETLTIVAYTTDSKSYTKEITARAEGIKFQEGYLNTLGANMSGITPENVASISGDFVILAKHNTTYYALKGEASGTRVASVDYTGNTTSFEGDASIIWTITPSGSAYTVKNGGNYLGWVSDSGNAAALIAEAEYDDDKCLMGIDKSGDIYSIHVNADATRILAKNSSSAYFAFYASTGQYSDIVLVPATALEVVATPSFNPAAGEVSSGTVVTISTATNGATIYYTTDGTTPSTSSTQGTSVTITATTTIKAIAVKDGMANSEIATATYSVSASGSVTLTESEITAGSNTAKGTENGQLAYRLGTSSANGELTFAAGYTSITFRLEAYSNTPRTFSVTNGTINSSASISPSAGAPSGTINAGFSRTDTGTEYTIDVSDPTQPVVFSGRRGIVWGFTAVEDSGSSVTWNLESIAITTEPTKTVYTEGESFDPAGMVVTGHFVDDADNSNTKDEAVTGYTISPNGALSTSDDHVTITYQGETATQAITVNAASSSHTISQVLAGGSGSYTLNSLLVYDVKGKNAIVGDNTGKMLLFIENHGLSAGDNINIASAVVTLYSNTTLEITGGTITTNSSGNAVDHGSATDLNNSSVASSTYDTFSSAGNHSALFVSMTGDQSGRNITGSYDHTTLYLNVADATNDGKKVMVTGYIYSWSSSYNNYNFQAVSIQEDNTTPALSVSPASLSWAADATDSKTLTVTLNGSAAAGDYTYNVTSGTASDWTITKNNGTLTVAPKAANTSTESAKAIIIRIAHASDGTVCQDVTCTQAKSGSVSATYTLTFPDDNSSSNGLTSNQYQSTWTATSGSTSWTITNFNNNNWLNSWSYIKCGRKNNDSVATITTSSVLPEAIKTVTITIDALTASKINSIKLYSSSNGSSWTQEGTFTAATGDKSVTISSPTTNRYYKLEFDCASGSSNGLLTLSKVVYTTN